LHAQDLKLFALDRLTKTKRLSIDKAKELIRHINPKYGFCIACGQESLKKENTNCNNCGKFNLNWKINQSFNARFSLHLEFHLCGCFACCEGAHEEIKGFWCDGVSPFPYDISELSRANLKRDKKITTKSWMGTSGQVVYQMTILFGEKSLQYYLNGKSMISCLPDYSTMDWININTSTKEISINLL